MALADRAVLVALFLSTDGGSWTQNRRWNTDAELSRWFGLQVNDEGGATHLCLEENNLEGMAGPAFPRRDSCGVLDPCRISLGPKLASRDVVVRFSASHTTVLSDGASRVLRRLRSLLYHVVYCSEHLEVQIERLRLDGSYAHDPKTSSIPNATGSYSSEQVELVFQQTF